MDLRQVVGQRIRDLRHTQGISQEVVAERAGLHYTHIQRIELGAANPTLDTLCRLAQALGVSLPVLLETEQPFSAELESLLGLIKDREPREIRLVLDLARVALRYVTSSFDGSTEEDTNV